MVRKKSKKKSEIPDDLVLTHGEYQQKIREREEHFKKILDRLDKEQVLQTDLTEKLDQLTEEKVEIEQLLTTQIIQKEDFIDSATDTFEVCDLKPKFCVKRKIQFCSEIKILCTHQFDIYCTSTIFISSTFSVLRPFYFALST